MTVQDKNEEARQSRLRKLLQRWTRRGVTIQKAYNEVGAMGPSESLKPSLFAKFTGWMEHISLLEKEEREIVSEIKFIEERHSQLRKEKRLRRAAPARAKPPALEEEPHPRRRSSWLWWVLLWVIADRHDKKN